MAKYILNTPVLTDYGTHRFDKTSPEDARKMAKNAMRPSDIKRREEACKILLSIYN